MLQIEVEVLGECFFSQIIGKPIYDADGRSVGKLHDMAVRWDIASPVVTCLQFARGIQRHIDISEIDQWNDQGFVLKRKWEDIVPRELGGNEIYVRKWLLDKQIIDLNGAKLVRVNDITLSRIAHKQRMEVVLAGVDIGVRGLFRRLGLEFLVKFLPHKLLGWQHMKPLKSKIDNLQLRNAFISLGELHPADIADIVEELGYSERKNLLDDLENDQVADVLSQVELNTQVQIIDELDFQQASDILEEMRADEVADILGELSAEKTEQILKLMEPENAEDVRELMNYPAETAGSLMTTEYAAFSGQLTVEDTIRKLRETAFEAETIYYIYVINDEGILQGVLSLRELILAEPKTLLGELMHTRVITAGPLEDQQKALEMVAKYGLIALPVVNESNRLLGIVTVDDLVEKAMPGRSEMNPLFAFMAASGKNRRQ